MAEARVSVNLDQFSCPICLDLLKDPVSIPCGHTFCMTCIKTQWDKDDQTGVYSCPLCRKNFTPRPDLGRNTLLAEMVEKLRNTHIADASLAGPEDETCDVCVGQKCKAVKSCLECLASYCGIHISLHDELNPGNKHRVIDTKYKLADRICSFHNKLKEVICCTEQKFMCHECALSMCKGHDVTTVSNERSRQETMLGATQAHIQQRTKESENRMKELRMAVKSIKSSANSLLRQSEMVFTNLIRSIERKRSEITEKIRAIEEAEVRRVEDMLKHLEKEVAKLKQRSTELAQLHLEDDFQFLKMNKTFSDFSTFDSVPKILVCLSTFEGMQNTVSEIATKVDVFCQRELRRISIPVKTVHIVQTSHPVIREDFLQYFCEQTVDPRTVHRNLRISGGNRKITFVDGFIQQTPDDLQRFNYFAQAVCTQVLNNRCYWEVEWGGQQVCIAATYKVVERQGCCGSIGFGYNDRSWSLCCSPSKFVFCHNSQHTNISGPVSKRVGIYLDHRSGRLSFYSISHHMTLLHRVQTSFTEALYPGFWVFDYSELKICGRDKKVTPQVVVSKGAKKYSSNDQFYLVPR